MGGSRTGGPRTARGELSMTDMLKGRRARAEKLQEGGGGQTPAPDANGAPEPSSGETEGIPPHVWDMLQQAGEEAARRLLDLIRSPRFSGFKPSEQRSLIELAMTRAYGLPVRRSVNVSLSSDDADAVAASLLDMREHLPERRGMVDVTPDKT